MVPTPAAEEEGRLSLFSHGRRPSSLVRFLLLLILFQVLTNAIYSGSIKSNKDSSNKEVCIKQSTATTEKILKVGQRTTTHAVIHIGPYKTGSTSIQSFSKEHIKELKADGYEMPWTNLVVKQTQHDWLQQNGNQVQFANCFLSTKIASKHTWQCESDLLLSGLGIAKRGQNLYVTAEGFSILGSSGIENLSDYLTSWDNVTIILTYRRLYDILQSWWNQLSKIEVYQKLTKPRDKLSYFRDKILKNDYGARFDSRELLRKYHQQFQNVIVLNYHDNSKDIVKTLYCDALPRSNATCSAITNPKTPPVERKNVAEDDIIYGQLALGAVEMGLTTKYKSPQDLKIVVDQIKTHQEEIFGLSRNEGFQMECLSHDHLNALFNKSKEIEKSLFPDFYSSVLGEANMLSDFEKQRTTKLCDIDLEGTLNKSEWQFFFKKILKRNLNKEADRKT